MLGEDPADWRSLAFLESSVVVACIRSTRLVASGGSSLSALLLEIRDHKVRH